jgi:pimeloyl-ACP methyl ester carboxylesterase
MIPASASASASAPSRLRIGGADLHVDPPQGDGPPLVLVHGAWTGASTWALLTGPLAADFTVVTYDRRGHTRSGRGPAAPTRRRHEDDLAALIESLGAGPVYLAGTSYGALLALELAGRRPDLVRGAVVHEPSAVALHPVDEMETLFAAVGAQIAAGDAPVATRRFFEDAGARPGRLAARARAGAGGRDRQRADVPRHARRPRVGCARRRGDRPLRGPDPGSPAATPVPPGSPRSPRRWPRGSGGSPR